MPPSQAEQVASLQRQVNSLSFELVRVVREHGQELAKKDQLRDEIVLKRDKRYKRSDDLLAGLRSERINLKRSLESVETQLEAKKHETQSLRQEVETLCGKLDTATTRIKVLKEAAMRNRPTRSDDGRRRRAPSKTKLAGRSRLDKLITVINRTTPSIHLAACANETVPDSMSSPSRAPASPDAAPKFHLPSQHQEDGDEGGVESGGGEGGWGEGGGGGLSI